jgi:hypothetical protein
MVDLQYTTGKKGRAIAENEKNIANIPVLII